MSINMHPGALAGWVPNFVRLSNRAAGITREPTTEEISAHRGLFAANVLRVENLEIFAGYVQPGAVLRDDTDGFDKSTAKATVVRDNLETLMVAAMRRAVPPLYLYRVYRLLQPFTAGNDRCARAFWMWQAMRGTPEDLEDLVALCPSDFAPAAPKTSTVLM